MVTPALCNPSVIFRLVSIQHVIHVILVLSIVSSCSSAKEQDDAAQEAAVQIGAITQAQSPFRNRFEVQVQAEKIQLPSGDGMVLHINLQPIREKLNEYYSNIYVAKLAMVGSFAVDRQQQSGASQQFQDLIVTLVDCEERAKLDDSSQVQIGLRYASNRKPLLISKALLGCGAIKVTVPLTAEVKSSEIYLKVSNQFVDAILDSPFLLGEFQSASEDLVGSFVMQCVSSPCDGQALETDLVSIMTRGSSAGDVDGHAGKGEGFDPIKESPSIIAPSNASPVADSPSEGASTNEVSVEAFAEEDTIPAILPEIDTIPVANPISAPEAVDIQNLDPIPAPAMAPESNEDPIDVYSFEEFECIESGLLSEEECRRLLGPISVTWNVSKNPNFDYHESVAEDYRENFIEPDAYYYHNGWEVASAPFAAIVEVEFDFDVPENAFCTVTEVKEDRVGRLRQDINAPIENMLPAISTEVYAASGSGSETYTLASTTSWGTETDAFLYGRSFFIKCEIEREMIMGGEDPTGTTSWWEVYAERKISFYPSSESRSVDLYFSEQVPDSLMQLHRYLTGEEVPSETEFEQALDAIQGLDSKWTSHIEITPEIEWTFNGIFSSTREEFRGIGIKSQHENSIYVFRKIMYQGNEYMAYRKFPRYAYAQNCPSIIPYDAATSPNNGMTPLTYSLELVTRCHIKYYIQEPYSDAVSAAWTGYFDAGFRMLPIFGGLYTASEKFFYGDGFGERFMGVVIAAGEVASLGAMCAATSMARFGTYTVIGATAGIRVANVAYNWDGSTGYARWSDLPFALVEGAAVLLRIVPIRLPSPRGGVPKTVEGLKLGVHPETSFTVAPVNVTAVENATGSVLDSTRTLTRSQILDLLDDTPSGSSKVAPISQGDGRLLLLREPESAKPRLCFTQREAAEMCGSASAAVPRGATFRGRGNFNYVFELGARVYKVPQKCARGARNLVATQTNRLMEILRTRMGSVIPATGVYEQDALWQDLVSGVDYADLPTDAAKAAANRNVAGYIDQARTIMAELNEKDNLMRQQIYLYVDENVSNFKYTADGRVVFWYDPLVVFYMGD